jgi:antitoxin VapB
MLSAYAEGIEMLGQDVREVLPFGNNRKQAVRVPVDFELPGDRALLRKEGERLILEPVGKAGLLGLLADWQPFRETFPDFGGEPARPEEVLG